MVDLAISKESNVTRTDLEEESYLATMIGKVFNRLAEITLSGFPVTFKLKPTAEQIDKTRSILDRARAMLEIKTSFQEINTALSLLANGLKLPRLYQHETMASAYYIALMDYSSWAIHQAVYDILQGKAEGLSRTFLPAAPELAAYCDTIEKAMKMKLKTIERALKHF